MYIFDTCDLVMIGKPYEWFISYQQTEKFTKIKWNYNNAIILPILVLLPIVELTHI